MKPWQHLELYLLAIASAQILSAGDCGKFETRGEFTRAMSKVHEGMKIDQLIETFGTPDDIRTQNDPGGISTTGTLEVWSYGSDTHLGFPTLGCIYVDPVGAQYMFGGTGNPIDPSIAPEPEIRRL